MTVDDYIAQATAASRPVLRELRRLIRATVPEAEERISYGVPFYRHHGALCGFAVYASHVSFGYGPGVLTELDRERLARKGYTTGKGTLRIRFDQEVPAAVVRRLLRARAKLNAAQKP